MRYYVSNKRTKVKMTFWRGNPLNVSRRVFLLTFSAIGSIALGITLWATGSQLIAALALGDHFALRNLYAVVLLVGFLLFISLFRAFVAAGVVTLVVTVVQKLLMRRAIKPGRIVDGGGSFNRRDGAE